MHTLRPLGVLIKNLANIKVILKITERALARIFGVDGSST